MATNYILNTDKQEVFGPLDSVEALEDKVTSMDDDEREVTFVLSLHEDASMTVEQTQEWFDTNVGEDEEDDDS